MSRIRQALLLGKDHLDFDAIAVDQVSPEVAIALSRGRYPKGYPHTDPNEDCVFASTDGQSTLLAVADGHSGHLAATIAIHSIRNSATTLLAAGAKDPAGALDDAFSNALHAVRDTLGEASDPQDKSRTSLTLALVGRTRLLVSGLGDSRAVVVTDSGAEFIGTVGSFLGVDTEEGAWDTDERPIEAGHRVLVASDGLFDFLGATKQRRLQDVSKGSTDAKSLAVGAVEAAFTGGAGDNVAVAVGFSVG